MTPQHKNPSPARTASAPYNFVPLPDAVVPAESLPDHNVFPPERHSGYFDVALTTRSPLYIRGGLTREDFRLLEQDQAQPDFRAQKKNQPAFFYIDPETRHPVIPGSSLRGMLRTMVEIITYAKVTRVTSRRLFYRSMGKSTLAEHYGGRMRDNVETGFLRRNPDGSYEITCCDMWRVKYEKLGGEKTVFEGKSPNQTPRWMGGRWHQYQQVSVDLPHKGKWVTKIKDDPKHLDKSGVLIISGAMQGKKGEFVFLDPSPHAETIAVSDTIIERFHDDDQITQWQALAFPKDQPLSREQESRQRDGMLQHKPGSPGEPVFFLREDGALTFLGRAYMFRLPYRHSPYALVPASLKDPGVVDMAEALFGFIRDDPDSPYEQGDKRQAYAGRVRVTDAQCETPQEDCFLVAEPLVPQILASPKPTTFQHYLVQASDEIRALRHYDSEETTIRGHKRYWPQGPRTADDLRETDPEKLAKIEQGESTQHTQISPLKAGVTFRFRVYFDNLSDAELGALAWALEPQGDPTQTYVHHLGMGKPLGMGCVQVTADLTLIERRERYRQLFDQHRWACSETHDIYTQPYLDAFETYLLYQLKAAGLKPRYGQPMRLADLKRIGELLKMMTWPGFPAKTNGGLYLHDEERPNTRYMTIKDAGGINEFTDRPVLPGPEAFGPMSGTLTWEAPEAPPRDTHRRATPKPAPKPPPEPIAIRIGRLKGFDYEEGEGILVTQDGKQLRFDFNDADQAVVSAKQGAPLAFVQEGDRAKQVRLHDP